MFNNFLNAVVSKKYRESEWMNKLDNKEIEKIANEILTKMERATTSIEKVNLIKYYFKMYKINNRILSRIYHTISNEAMVDEAFCLHLLRFNFHYRMLNNCNSDNHMWLITSCFWNIFRYNRCRSYVKKDFVERLLKDNYFLNNKSKIQNTYFGCLSNISLDERFKPIISDKLMSLKKINLNVDPKIITSLNGLLANLAVNDTIAEKIIKSYIYKYNLIVLKDLYLSKMKIEKLEVFFRNSMAFINNISNIKDFNEYIIEIDLYEAIVKVLKTNNFNESNNLKNMVKAIFKIEDFDETTSLHLANTHNYKDLVLKKIKNNFDINTQDKNGNTILHNALINANNDLAKFYILCDANINIENNQGVLQKNLNPTFVSKILKLKEKTDNTYKKLIREEIEENCSLYEKGHIKNIFGYVNKYDDMCEW